MDDTSRITILRSKRRSISLHIGPNATLIVRAPLYTPERQIHTFIQQQKTWIDTHLTRARRLLIKKNDDTYLFLGNEVQFKAGSFATISIKDGELLFPQGLVFRKKKELTTWYYAQAKNIITKQATTFAQEMLTGFKEISFTDTKSQWGRCTHDNRLQFSWRLVMAPMLVLNYVVIHELAHTTEKNHTRAFWAIVRKHTPSYRQQIRWLREHGATLQISI